MDVYQAVGQRSSVRAFADRALDRTVIGMVIGYREADHPANSVRRERAPIEENVNLLGWP